jgi:serine/threonine protein kinase
MDTQFIGRYEVKSEIGRGGMATVFHAYDPRFKRDVAIKVLPREFLHDPSFRARFGREAEIIASLEHPAIVPVHDFGEEDGQPYLVMRLMTGGSLSDRMARGPLSLTETARILTQLAPALDRAHARGVIHRDLKPGNILFDDEGNAYIADFGIARLVQATVSFTGNAVIGTPAYMSPEQGRGDKDIDGRSDIYALGAMVYHMLTGIMPYEADTPMGIVVKHITEPVPKIREARPDLPPQCDTLIQTAMAKAREGRYPTATALSAALHATLSGRDVFATEVLPDAAAQGATAVLTPSIREAAIAGLRDARAGRRFVFWWIVASGLAWALAAVILSLVLNGSGG